MDLSHLSDDARDRLDDACLSILMEDFSHGRGERLLEETRKLNADAAFDYPGALDQACLRAVDRHFAREKRRAALQGLRRAANAAAALLVIAALSWAVLFSTVDSVRLSTMDRFGVGFVFPFEIMFSIVFLLVIGLFLVIASRGIAQWTKNNASPRLTVEAEVVAKRSQISHHASAGHPGMHTATSYYVTFEVESGDRMELHVDGWDFGLLAEGDHGRLSFQGTRFLGFERA